MYKTCMTEQSAQRQRELEQGLLRMMMEKHYDEISISELCQSMGIPRKAFYRYFTGKDGALHGLIDHTLLEFESFHSAYLQGKTRTLELDLERYFAFWLDRKPLMDALDRSNLMGVLMQRAVEYAIGEIAFPGRFLPNENRETQDQVISFSISGLMIMTIQWHHEGYRRSPRYLAEIAARLLTKPLFPDVGKLL